MPRANRNQIRLQASEARKVGLHQAMNHPKIERQKKQDQDDKPRPKPGGEFGRVNNHRGKSSCNVRTFSSSISSVYKKIPLSPKAR